MRTSCGLATLKLVTPLIGRGKLVRGLLNVQAGLATGRKWSLTSLCQQLTQVAFTF